MFTDFKGSTARDEPEVGSDASSDSTNQPLIRGIQDHALIGNLQTAALISLDGSVEQWCVPHFDSPSIFARIVDAEKGGHWSISPRWHFRTKQQYMPQSNVLVTKFLNDKGIGMVTDYLITREACIAAGIKTHLTWMLRKVHVIRGKVPFRMECAPAFNYCRDDHVTTFEEDKTVASEARNHSDKVLFKSKDLSMDLRYFSTSDDGDVACPVIKLEKKDLGVGLLGDSIVSEFELEEGQTITFIMRESKENQYANAQHEKAANPGEERAKELGIDLKDLVKGATFLRPNGDPIITKDLLESLEYQTMRYWQRWIGKSKYKGRWREAVHRSALTLKMLVFEETGAVVAAPTFSLPEAIGGPRNWDYRYTWIRDTSFVLYALIRLGFTEEANAFMDFIMQRLRERNSDGSLQIVYTIHGGKDLGEEELTHLSGHKGSKPVRIGNGAVDHLQLDIYGELMDAIYLAQKFSKPLSWEGWVAVRQVIDYVVTQVGEPDLSIWEVRGKKKNFLYSKVMMWVALDRGLRLAEKRNLPCPNRIKWFETRDALYEEIQTKGWNAEKKFYGQSYEDLEVMDSAVLIMPLTFFTSAADTRFISTLDQILKTPEKGGLTANNTVFRYDTEKADDGIGGEEGAFSMCTLWAIEALSRAGSYGKKAYLQKAVEMFEDFLGYGNHVGLFSEEISRGGEGLGNTPQAFSHVQLISCAYNLDRCLEGRWQGH